MACAKPNQEKKYTPFTLQYITFAKMAWVMGKYEQIPVPLRNEPKPYKDGESYMVKEHRHLIKSNITRIRPTFYKEYFDSIEQERKKAIIKHNENIFINRSVITKPEHMRDISLCAICWLKKHYPNIERHKPHPWPNTYCALRGEREYHFKDYNKGNY